MESSSSSSSSSKTIILTSGASGRVNALFSRWALRSLLSLLNAFFLLLLLPFRGYKSRQVSANLPDKEAEKQEINNGRKGGGGPVVRVPAAIVARRTAIDQEVAARRALAIRRVIGDANENVVRDFCLFVPPRGVTLFTQSWSPTNGKIRGLVVVLHGLNEHSGRYSNFAKQLTSNGFKVYAMDWIGHGGSDGLHAYVPSLDDAVADTKSYIDKVLAENPGLPCFCFGHSTGGAIILKTAMDPQVESCISGIITTSPAVGVQPSHPIFGVIAPVISFLLPKYQLSAANKPGPPVSRDPEALVAKYSDPLVFTGSVRVRTGYEILRITAHLQRNLKKVRVPFLVLHGTSDTVTDPEATKKLYDEASSEDKTIRLLDGFLHDLLFEPESDEIIKDIIE
ncbi:Serine aminopeptidase, S33, partial [Dillenia turbinata]